MNIVVFLIVGLVAGWLASALIRGRGLGLIGDIVIGVIGAFLGGFLLGLFGIFAGGIVGLIIQSFIGAVVLLIIIKALRKI
ncbi:MAG TPA: GlsB/YeaQ/YmgE family stress response membrane protein [Proteobacteria bacterium]|nr:GlsB/YeaQ/YmgE family stress response membrane protein [Pseudomonadota bacterium]